MKHHELDSLDWHDRFSYKKNIPFAEDDLNQKGSKFQIVRFLPHTRIGPHYHKRTHEIFYIQNGRGVILFNSEEYQVKQGDIFLCEPGDVHEIINDSNTELVILIFKTNEEPGDIIWLDQEDENKYS